MIARHDYNAETGTHYNYFRDYDPAVGRYVQSDPIGLVGGLNTYGYAEGSPMALVDPLGLTAIPMPPLPAPGMGSGSGMDSGSGAGWGGSGSWGNGSSDYPDHRRDFDHNPGKDSCGKCRDCMPSKGTLCRSQLHVDRSHYPLERHYHMFIMTQDPECHCRWRPARNQFKKGVAYPEPENSIPCPFRRW